MTKSWDSHLKLLAKTVPQDLVSWLLKGAISALLFSGHKVVGSSDSTAQGSGAKGSFASPTINA
jgi:lipid-A-disaccharide synthase-like uncharacterized protein